MSQEVLLKMNANGVNLDHIAGGGPCLIDAAALAIALARATPAEYSLAALKVLGDKKEKHSVYAWLFEAGFASDLYQVFKVKHLGCLDRLCDLVIDEFVNMPHCKTCNGSKVDEKYNECPKCGGTGIKTKSLRQRIKPFGKSASCWYQYADMHAFLFRVLQQWDDSNQRKLDRWLR